MSLPSCTSYPRRGMPPDHFPLRRPVDVRAAVAAIVIASGQTTPALVPLAGDISLAGLPLRIEGVEVLIESFLGALARVDGTAHGGGRPAAGCRVFLVVHAR